MDADTIFFQTIRLAPDHLTCDATAFVRRAHRVVLDAEPVSTGSGTVMPPGDIYDSRTTYLHHLLISDESLARGYEAMTDGLARMLSGSRSEIMADMIRDYYPSIDHLVVALELMMSHVCENARRQDRILALSGI